MKSSKVHNFLRVKYCGVCEPVLEKALGGGGGEGGGGGGGGWR